MQSPADIYREQATESVVESSPLQTVQWLMQYIMDALVSAKGAIHNNNYQAKAKSINDAMKGIGILQGSLDKEKGGDIAENLESLYIYMTSRLLHASIYKEEKAITEVQKLMQSVKEGFDGIAPVVDKT
jgi:flagellar secretion chaperone FliS